MSAADLVHVGGPTREVLFDLAAGRVHAETAVWLQQHVSGCALCQHLMARITAAREALEPPAEAPFARQRHLAEVQHRLQARRSNRRWLLFPIASAALAGVMAFVFIMKRQAPPQPTALAPPLSCTIVARAGEASIEAGGKAAAGAPLAAGQSLTAQANARVLAHWGEATVEVEGGETGARVRWEAGERGERRLHLERGRVLLDVNPLPSGTTLAVITDDARVTVHGTRFLVEKGKHGTTVACDRGLVRVASRGASAAVDVAAGSRLATGGVEPIASDETTALDRIGRWPTAPERTSGTLEVLADVAAAEIVVDGEPVGVTPLSISMAPGTHKLHVSAPGRLPIEQTVEVAADATTTIHAELRSILEEETAAPRRGAPDLLTQARALVFSGSYERALAVLAQLRRKSPPAPVLARATLLEAQTYRLQRRPEQALALFERVARGSGHEAEQARYLLAQTLARDLSDPKRATAAWQTALKRFPQGMFHEEEIYRLGESQLAADQPLEGIRTLSHYVKDFPKGSHAEDAHLLVASAERDRLNDCAEAVVHFRAVATAGGRRAPQASIAEARCLRSLGRLPEARTAYLRYLSQAPRGRFAEEARAQAQVRRSGVD